MAIVAEIKSEKMTGSKVRKAKMGDANVGENERFIFDSWNLFSLQLVPCFGRILASKIIPGKSSRVRLG